MADRGSERFAGKRILIVEDDWFLASDMVQQIEEVGGRILGPIADVETALQAADNEEFDAALLNMAIGKETSFPVADVLRRRQIPFAFASAYEVGAFPSRYADVPNISKPFELRIAARALFG